MSVNPMTRNITAVYRHAAETDRIEGIEWYARARRLAVELDPENIERAAGVIAALSPRLAWRKNVEYARDAYRVFGFDFSASAFVANIKTLKANAHKAYRILAGESPDDVLGGPKVRAFYFTIVNPYDPRAVVVDRHALDITVNHVQGDAERGKMLGHTGAYDAISNMYRRAARILSTDTDPITPAQVQAVTWLYWRRERAAAFHG